MLNFPDSPSDGEQSTQPNGITYQWDATLTRWTSVISLGAGIVAGTVVQMSHLFDNTFRSGSNTMPAVGVPQITDGNAGFSMVFTPKYADSKLLVEVEMTIEQSTTSSPRYVGALFRDAESAAIRSRIVRADNTNDPVPMMSFKVEVDANGINPITFSLRYGISVAGTARFNSVGAAQQLGGNAGSSITITEIQPDAVTVSGSNDFDDKLAGYLDTGLHVGYNGNLDDIAVNSCYNVETATGGLPSDYVIGDQGFVTTYISTGGGTVSSQVLIGLVRVNQYKQWMRHNDSGTWSEWVLVVDGSNKKYAARASGAGSPFWINGMTLSKTGVGVYQYTFNTPLVGDKYVITGMASAATGIYVLQYLSVTTTSFEVRTYTFTAGAFIANDVEHRVEVRDYN